MAWNVRFHDAFEKEFQALDQKVQDELLATAKLLTDYGPKLGRPHADTLKGSRFPNMKEFRFKAADGVWRVALPSIPSGRQSCSWAATNQGQRGQILQTPDRKSRRAVREVPGRVEDKRPAKAQEGEVTWAAH
jgi:hypothetical protein